MSAPTKIKPETMMAMDVQLDPMELQGLNPNLAYKLIRTDKAEEILKFRRFGWMPAVGKEYFVTNQMQGIQQSEGKEKVLGNRILYCIEKAVWKARQKAAANKYSHYNKETAQAEAHTLTKQAHNQVQVEAL